MDYQNKIIDGRALAAKHEQQLRVVLEKMLQKPHVVSILVGDDPASIMYTNMKQKKAEELGINFEVRRFPISVQFEKVVREIEKLNFDDSVCGIMVQLPLPKEFLRERKTDRILEVIDTEKDVDGLTRDGPVLPATVRGILSILKAEKALGIGKKIRVVGGVHGMVGTSLVIALKARREDVVGVSRDDAQIVEKTLEADVLISAVGQKNLITQNMVKQGALVIDVGQDIDFENVQNMASRITPPKGGVGPMTIISLMENAAEISQR